jgi:hypothetical protein
MRFAVHSIRASMALLTLPLAAGPYSAASLDATNPHDAPVPGFVGPHGAGKARLNTFTVDGNDEPIFENPNNFVNPLFFSWAANVVHYAPSEFVSFSNTDLALGPVTGDNFDVVSLGDLSSAAITAGTAPGTITLELGKPVENLSGADFVVFENGHITQTNQGGAGVGGIFAELARIEVSANGTDFVRFPSTSLTTASVGGYGSLDPTNLHHLAGKHQNAYGNCWGTPFDLTQVGLARITHIRIVDVPGNGTFTDASGNPIYDPWKTFGSAGFDLEAVGAISTLMIYQDWPALSGLPADKRGMNDDPDADGLDNLTEYAFARVPWLADSAEAAPVFRIVADGGNRFPEISFLRDERLADLTYEVQCSTSLTANAWTTIARGIAGAATQAAEGRLPLISESSGSGIASVGVIRKVTVRDEIPVSGSSPRFYRIKVSATP